MPEIVIAKPVPSAMSKLDFLKRLTFAERVAIETAAETDPEVRVVKQSLLAADEIRVGPRALGIEAEEWMALLTRRLGLTTLMRRAPFRLSGGEKKRVAVAAALAARPEVLILDEPTAGQDLFFRQALGDLLNGLAEEGRAVLMVTHDLGFAERHAPRWLVLGEGTILADGTPAQIMADGVLMQRCGLMPTDAFRLKTRLEAAGHA